MRKILILAIIIPNLCLGQTNGKIFIDYQFGYLIDEFNPKMDINPYSPDMQSNFNNRDDITNGIKYSIGYYLTNELSVGINYMNEKISGSNEIESYIADFTERNLFASYDVFNFNNLIIFTRLSIGEVLFSNQRKLIYDGSLIPGNCINCSSKKSSYGAGVLVKLNEDLKITFNISRNLVEHDGFDGWDYGSGSDQYLYKSIGIRMYLDN